MRQPKRIQIILNEFKNHDNIPLALSILGEQFIPYTPAVAENLDKISEYWTNYPDLRLTQVLVNLGIIPNTPGFWYHMEDEQLMIQAGILEGRDIYFWGKSFDSLGNILPQHEYILIKDMELPHIKAILRDNEEGLLRVNPLYLKMFHHELLVRNSEEVKYEG